MWAEYLILQNIKHLQLFKEVSKQDFIAIIFENATLYI